MRLIHAERTRNLMALALATLCAVAACSDGDDGGGSEDGDSSGDGDGDGDSGGDGDGDGDGDSGDDGDTGGATSSGGSGDGDTGGTGDGDGDTGSGGSMGGDSPVGGMGGDGSGGDGSGGGTGDVPDPGFDVGRTISIDFGDMPTTDSPWGVLGVSNSNYIRLPIRDDEGTALAGTLQVGVDPVFVGMSADGIAANDVGLPSTATEDYFFAGSFASHEFALMKPAEVVFRGLNPSFMYDLSLFCSVNDNDDGKGHLGRYTVDGQVQEFDASLNTDTWLNFDGVSPEADGELRLRIEVSENGNALRAVINALQLTNAGP